jgi:hypothetical protein
MTRRAYVYFVATFLIGIVVGGGGMYYYAWSAGKWRHPWSENVFVHYWTKQLALTPSQTKQLRSITDDTIKEHAALDKQERLRLEALREKWRTRVRQALPPQQVRKFDEVIHRHDEARKKKR